MMCLFHQQKWFMRCVPQCSQCLPREVSFASVFVRVCS
jgi:hypothetical protein